MDFVYDVLIGADNHERLAETMTREALHLLDAGGWAAKVDRNGMRVATKDVVIHRHPSSARGGGSSRNTVTRASVSIDAPRERVFALLSDPGRGHEWDPLDRGYEPLERYGEDELVFRALSKPPLSRMRASALFMVRRPDCRDGLSVHGCRTVSHRADPPGRMPRFVQQIFYWAVRDAGPNRCDATALVSTPEGILPSWLMKATAVPGWLSILKKIRASTEAA